MHTHILHYYAKILHFLRILTLILRLRPLQDTVSQNGEEIEFSVHRGASGDGSGGASEISSLTSFMRHQAVD